MIQKVSESRWSFQMTREGKYCDPPTALLFKLSFMCENNKNVAKIYRASEDILHTGIQVSSLRAEALSILFITL